MNPLDTTSKPKSQSPHCSALSPSGRRCRMAVSDPPSGLCAHHAARRLSAADTGDFSAQLVAGVERFDSAIQINQSLGELYKLLAGNKISPRRGAVLAYTANLLLRTLPAIERESPQEEPQIIFDLPRPKRDWPEGKDPGLAAHENWDAYVASLNIKPLSPSGDFQETSKFKLPLPKP